MGNIYQKILVFKQQSRNVRILFFSSFSRFLAATVEHHTKEDKSVEDPEGNFMEQSGIKLYVGPCCKSSSAKDIIHDTCEQHIDMVYGT